MSLSIQMELKKCLLNKTAYIYVCIFYKISGDLRLKRSLSQLSQLKILQKVIDVFFVALV